MALQLSCLLGSNVLPSWEFDNEQINHCRSTVFPAICDAGSLTATPATVSADHTWDEARYGSSFPVTIQLPAEQEGNNPSSQPSSKTLFVTPTSLAGDVVRELCNKCRKTLPLQEPESYFLQVAGRLQYVLDSNIPIGRVDYVRQCLRAKRRIKMRLVSGSQLNLALPSRAIDAWKAVGDKPGNRKPNNNFCVPRVHVSWFFCLQTLSVRMISKRAFCMEMMSTFSLNM